MSTAVPAARRDDRRPGGTPPASTGCSSRRAPPAATSSTRRARCAPAAARPTHLAQRDAAGTGIVDACTVVHRAPRRRRPSRRTSSPGSGCAEGVDPAHQRRDRRPVRRPRSATRSPSAWRRPAPTAARCPSSTRTRGELMNFELDEDQREFKALLRTFVDKEIIPVAREWEQAGRYPTEIVDGMKEMGLFGITVPEEYGGLDLDPVSFALVFEEIARGWMGIAGILGSHSLACRLIAMHGTEEQKQQLPARARHRRAAHRHRPHRARRRHRPAGHPDHGPARRRPLRRQRREDVDHQRPLRRPAAGAGEDRPDGLARPQGHERAAGRGGHPRLRGHQGHPEARLQGHRVLRDLARRRPRARSRSCSAASRARGMQQVLSALEWGRVNIAARSVGIAQRALRRGARRTPSSARRSASRSRTSRRSSSSSASSAPRCRPPG